MNIYDDYGNYMEDLDEVITNLKATSSYVMLYLDDVIKVLDYIYRKYLDKAKIDNDLAEIFEGGFGYIANNLNDIKVYYEEYFKKDMIVFNHYAELICYSIMIDDLKSYLDAEEKLSKVKENALTKALLMIDDILINHKEVDQSIINNLETVIEECTPKNGGFKPVYIIYSMIGEELGLY